jgi:hypothetical protein
MDDRTIVWTSQTPPKGPVYVPVDLEVHYEICHTCWYEKVSGDPCGEPCV